MSPAPLTVTSFRVGVRFGSVVLSAARYCTYRELPGMSSPELAIGVKALQVRSGVGVLPVRTLIAIPVPDGVAEFQLSAPQSTLWPGPASKTRESKVPEAG